MTSKVSILLSNALDIEHRRKPFVALAVGCSILLGSFLLTDVSSADEDSVRQYLSETANTQYLQKGNSRIERELSDREIPAGSIVFQKYINDIPLHGGRVIVFEDADGRVTRVFDDSTENLKLRIAKPTYAAEEAEEMIEEANDLATDSQSKLVWFRAGNSAIAAWEVTTVLADSGAPASPTGLETVIDATTGEMLSQRQLDTKTYEPGSPETADSVYPRIVINDNIGPAGSRAYAAPFDAIVEVDFGCSGVLVADDFVLCARHCGVGAGDTIIFGDNANNPSFSISVQSSFLPDGGGSLLDGGDVSILRLNGTVPSNIATPMRLIDATDELEGMVCATLGYGFNGVGSQGHNFSADGFRWGGENIIDVYGSPAGSGGSNIISTDFDNGTAAANEIPGSSPVPLEFEATTAPGDSGGPVLVQNGSEWLVAGVLSGGTTSTSVYGDISWWTGTAIFKSDIEANGGVFAGGTDITFPNGMPEFISSNGGDMLEIEVVSEEDSVVPGSGALFVDSGSGFQQFGLIENSSTNFTAVFPASDCLTSVQYYISFQMNSGTIITAPNNAPSATFSVLSAIDVMNTFSDSFDTNMGWTVSGPAIEGRWERAIPNNGDRGDPAQDAEPTGNGFCYVTDNDNSADDNSDVDDGETILTSPILDASGGANDEAFLSYYRWYSNDFGNSPNEDIFVVEISNNGGATWSNLETVGPSGPGTGGGWIFVEHRISDFLTPTNNMRVRFNASDLGDGSVVEAGVDAVTVRMVSCEDEVLHGDVNLDGEINLLDVAPFIDRLSSGEYQAEADVNKDGIVNLLDVAPFIDLIGG